MKFLRLEDLLKWNRWLRPYISGFSIQQKWDDPPEPPRWDLEDRSHRVIVHLPSSLPLSLPPEPSSPIHTASKEQIPQSCEDFQGGALEAKTENGWNGLNTIFTPRLSLFPPVEVISVCSRLPWTFHFVSKHLLPFEIQLFTHVFFHCKISEGTILVCAIFVSPAVSHLWYTALLLKQMIHLS